MKGSWRKSLAGSGRPTRRRLWRRSSRCSSSSRAWEGRSRPSCSKCCRRRIRRRTQSTRPQRRPPVSCLVGKVGQVKLASRQANLGPTGHSGPPGRLCHPPPCTLASPDRPVLGAQAHSRARGSVAPPWRRSVSRCERAPMPARLFNYVLLCAIWCDRITHVPTRRPGTWTARRQPQHRRGRRTARPTRPR